MKNKTIKEYESIDEKNLDLEKIIMVVVMLMEILAELLLSKNLLKQ